MTYQKDEPLAYKTPNTELSSEHRQSITAFMHHHVTTEATAPKMK